MPSQLRDYRIRAGAVDLWLDEWARIVRPLRERLGFRVDGAWVDRAGSRFVWVVSCDGDFEAADRAYYDSPERRALEPDPARHIEQVQLTLMEALR